MAKDTPPEDAISEITLLDRRILALLPKVGDRVGHHDLKKPVRSLVEDLHYEVGPDKLNGRLRGMGLKGLVVLVDGEQKNRAGWQVTDLGLTAVRNWDTFLFSHALMQATREGDGLAEVAVEDGPVVGYVVTPARFERMADDPVGGKTTINAKGA